MSKNYFQSCMSSVLLPTGYSDSEEIQNFANKQLAIAANCSISQKIDEIKDQKESSWWNSSCSIEHLYKMRDDAVAKNNHIDVITFTSMIAMRESV